jgi:trigger factor
MQVTETKSDGLKHAFTVVLAAAEIDEKLTARLAQVGQEVRLPGFRPGKVPASILKKRFGDAVMGEVIEQAVNDSSSQAIMERDLRPALQPKVEITTFEEGADLEYTMEFEVLPTIEPPDLTKMSLERRLADIPDDEIELVFDKFAQSSKTKSKAGGTGLGLAICREIIQQHGGKIWAEANRETGARFVVKFPLVEAVSQAA